MHRTVQKIRDHEVSQPETPTAKADPHLRMHTYAWEAGISVRCRQVGRPGHTDRQDVRFGTKPVAIPHNWRIEVSLAAGNPHKRGCPVPQRNPPASITVALALGMSALVPRVKPFPPEGISLGSILTHCGLAFANDRYGSGRGVYLPVPLQLAKEWGSPGATGRIG
jgi:hypothetical protein